MSKKKTEELQITFERRPNINENLEHKHVFPTDTDKVREVSIARAVWRTFFVIVRT